MAKAKTGSVPNKALYSRVSYLYQAAAYMATQRPNPQSLNIRPPAGLDENCEKIESSSKKPPETRVPLSQPASRRLVSELRAVSNKVLMRISPAMKHSICKNCDTMMMDGSTRTSTIENRSKGGKKPWADILVRKCSICGMEKRFPLAAERQERRPKRKTQENAEIDVS